MRESKSADRLTLIFFSAGFFFFFFSSTYFCFFASTALQVLFADSRLLTLLLILRTIREPRLVYTFIFAAVSHRKTTVRRQHAFLCLSSSAAIR